jgi:hypothetical protein
MQQEKLHLPDEKNAENKKNAHLSIINHTEGSYCPQKHDKYYFKFLMFFFFMAWANLGARGTLLHFSNSCEYTF